MPNSPQQHSSGPRPRSWSGRWSPERPPTFPNCAGSPCVRWALHQGMNRSPRSATTDRIHIISRTQEQPMPDTHEVTNQPPDLVGHDVADDPALLAGMRREGAEWAESEVHELGRLAGSHQAQRWGRLANENEPTLHTHDRVGNRLDEVEYHPHYHDLMDVAVTHNMHAAAWRDDQIGRASCRRTVYVQGRDEALRRTGGAHTDRGR